MYKREFRIAASYDTETCNLRDADGRWVAYPVLYIVNDLRGCDLRSYEVGDGDVSFLRHGPDVLSLIADYVRWGACNDVIPVICAYNLMFDLQPLMYDLNQMYDMEASAQSSTSCYTVDLVVDGDIALRFWDMFYLEMRGLEKMGEVCGVAKAVGDWDYTLIRTPDTELTRDELHYAARDVEVLPAYLRYLLESNEWLRPEWLGSRVLTKTSLVRQAGKMETGKLRITREDGSCISVLQSFKMLCASQLAPTYEQYALRKACFRGGFTFTAARTAGVVMHNVISIDETSAHHAYINGHMLPVDFKGLPIETLQSMAECITRTCLQDVFEHWEEPFGCAIHAQIRIDGIRLREGSAFKDAGIALLSEGKFKRHAQCCDYACESDKAAISELRSSGYVDVGVDAQFAFGKLYSASSVIINVNELELWCISRVYDWDSLTVLFGEGTAKFTRPPDYVTLLSNLFYERKAACKNLLKTYVEGTAYDGDISPHIPMNIANKVRTGEMRVSDLEGYYNSTVKGMFNSIYGTQAQDVFKPDYVVVDGSVEVDRSTVVNRDNYKAHYDAARDKLVLYPYGMRIAGGSRMAIIAAIELIHDAFGEDARILGGDTDSLKIACADGASPDAVISALRPLHAAVKRSIDVCMERVRKRWPNVASGLDGVGTFEVEGAPYEMHMEAWNKARVSWDGKHAHVTCAGLSRPDGAYTIESWLDDMSALYGFDKIAPLAMGWGVRVSNDVCHALEHARPRCDAVFDDAVRDYLGDVHDVTSREAIALYDADRVLGDTSKRGNERTVRYLERHYGRRVDLRGRCICLENGRAALSVYDEYGEVRIWST